MQQVVIQIIPDCRCRFSFETEEAYISGFSKQSRIVPSIIVREPEGVNHANQGGKFKPM